MGGLACWQRFSAAVPFDSIPTVPADLAEFDSGMRTFFLASEVPEALIAQLSLKSLPAAINPVMIKVCATLKKRVWSHADRVFLMDIAESLYE